MKISRTKKLPLLLAAGAFAFAAAGIGLMGRDFKTADALEYGPVTLRQTDALGNEVNITVEYVEGVVDGKKPGFVLADFLRNIFVYNGQAAIDDGVLTDGGRTGYEDMNGDGVFDDRDNSILYLSIDNFSNYLYVSETGDFDPMAVSLFYNTVQAYDYYTEANVGLDWCGVNGKNDEIWSNLYYKNEQGDVVQNPNEYPIRIFAHVNTYRWTTNAAYVYLPFFWESRIIVGDGTADRLYHTGAEIDTLAHEYQHGVTRFLTQLDEEDGGLSIYGDPGALNEGISDMFGMLVKAKDRNLTPSDEAFWHISGAVNQVLRNAANPAATGNTANYGNAPHCTTPGCDHTGCYDTGYVHVNSTLFTHLQYVACQKSAYFTTENIGKLWLEIGGS